MSKKDGVTVEYSVGGKPMSLEEAARTVLAETLPPGKVKRIEDYLRYDFTKDELIERAQELGRTTQEIQRIEDQLTTVKKSIQSEIAEMEAKRNRLSNSVAAGYEMRNVPCEVRFNEPEPKQKTIVRLDTGEIVATKLMDSYELQEEIQFEAAPGPEPADAPAK